MANDDTAHLGIGVMLNRIFGSDSASALRAVLGQTIASLAVVEEKTCVIVFEDGRTLTIFDRGQSCCESRYMRTDDALTDYVGASFLGAETRSAPNLMDEYGDHEVQFLVLKTSKGDVTFSSHNEHNGYYGGFATEATLTEKES